MLHVDAQKHPLFSEARYEECVLQPGDMVYIPRHHWHWIAAIDKDTAMKFKIKNNCSRVDSNCSINTATSNNDNTCCYNTNIMTEVFQSGKTVVGATLSSSDDCSRQKSSEHFSFSVNFWWGRRILKEKNDKYEL